MQLVSKRVGETSFSHVQRVRSELEAVPGKRHAVCHAGALDPFASGLLPVLIGSATKLFDHVHTLPKTYEASVAWGLETETGDAGGAAVATGNVSTLSAARIEAALTEQLGWQAQVPPATSNKRVDGERAWKRAHRGEDVQLPPSRVFLFSARVDKHQAERTELTLTCGGGFYVRSLARDLGRALGARAHLVELRRVAIGPWVVSAAPAELLGLEGFGWFPRVTLADDEWGRLQSARTTSIAAQVTPAPWSFPAGFPQPARQLVLATHQARVVALVERSGGDFTLVTSLLPPI